MKTITYDALRYIDGVSGRVEDALTTETALAILLNGEPLTVTMQTPGHELELVRGLLFTEGIYKNRTNEFQMDVLEKDNLGHITKVGLRIPPSEASVINKRTLLSVSACGICGKQELDFVEGHLAPGEVFSIARLPELFESMASHQQAFQDSGGCHASAAFTSNGTLLTVMEDVGRHNAVDKVIGTLLGQNKLAEARILLVSGRVSYEIVAKTFMAGIPILAAVSAPSSLAVDFSKELGLTLLGFCRGSRATIYAHPERIQS